MMEKKICPFMSSQMRVTDNPDDTGLWTADCREAKCALWTRTRDYEGCAYTVQVLELNDLKRIYAARGPI